MRGNRVGIGALSWLLTLQFFVLEAVALARYSLPYTRSGNPVSTLGAAFSPGHALLNASFVAQAVLIVLGALLVLPALGGAAPRVAQLLLGVAALGAVLTGLFPSDRNGPVHTAGEVLLLLGGALGLLALAYAVRARSELLGTGLAVLGLVSTAAALFYLDAVTGLLGEGGTERLALYPVPIGLAVTGVVLARMAGREGRLPAPDAGTSRRELREAARAEQAERQRERDEALEALARRQAATPARAAPPLAGGADDAAEDDIDPDDPWASPRRR